MAATGDVIAQVVSNHPMNPDVDNESNYQRRMSILREFALNTTTHGIAGIARSRSILNRIFWTLSCMTFTGIMLYFIILAICAYFEYPSQTKVTITSERIQEFPAITICNAGGLRQDTLSSSYNEHMAKLNISTSNNDSTLLTQVEFIRMYFPQLINEDGSLSRYIFPLDAMLLQCVYVGKLCSAKDFISFDSAAYGRCYTFNAKTKNGTVRYNHETDNTGKLTLRLYIHAHQYIPLVSEGAAMMTMVHNNIQLPLIEKAGMTLAPGFQHRLAYVRRDMHFLRPPYSSCTSEIPLVMQKMFEKYEGAEYVYSEDLCHMLCSQAYIYDQCGCVSPVQWNARVIVLPGTNRTVLAQLCNVYNICYVKAMDEFDLTQSIQDQYCSHCLQQCSITQYVIRSSLSTTPPDWLIPLIKVWVENTSIPLANDWSTQWRQRIQESYLSLELFSESSLIETFTEMPALRPVDIVSNVGGQTGLWIGISFLTVMEFIEMLFRLILHQIRLSRLVGTKNIQNTKKLPDTKTEA